jgi:hypothetical protein
MIMTLSGLVAQTVKELQKLTRLFRIIVLHADSSLNSSGSLVVLPKIPNNHNVWDRSNPINIRTVIVTTYNTASSQYGPTGQTKWFRLKDAKYQPPEEGHPPLDPNWPDNPKGRVRGIIADESQVGLRNESTWHETIRYFNAPLVYLFSGSPTPRGLKDWCAYLGVLQKEELAEKAAVGDEACNYSLELDPYEVDDQHPAAKYRFTVFAYKKWILNNTDLTEYQKGLKASKMLKHMVLRRDYASACPIGSEYTIARNLPPLQHFSVERLFSPTAQRLYDTFFKQWAGRLILLPEQGGSEDPIPNPRATRAVSLLTFCPLLGYLHKLNPEYNPPPKKGEDGYVPFDERPKIGPKKKTPQNDPDHLSWFNPDSDLYKKAMPKIGNDFKRWRWLLAEISNEGCTEIPTVDYKDKRTVSNKQILEIILRFSPKLAAQLSMIAEHALLRDEKMLVWFAYPITQELVAEVLMNMKHLKDVYTSLDSTTSQTRRDEIQEEINDVKPSCTLRILLASMLVGGVGLNFQEDSWICCLFEAAESLDAELQVIGRQHRLGQLMAVLVYSLIMKGTVDDGFVA